MTAAEKIRSDSDKRSAVLEWLSSDIGQEALAAVTQAVTDAPPLGTTGTDIVRMFGEAQERQRFVPRLFELTTPIQPEQPRPPENFGTPHTVDEFDQVTSL